MSIEDWRVYLTLRENSALYCDISNRLQERFVACLVGEGVKYTRLNKPAAMHIISDSLSKSETLKREIAVRELTAGEKRALWVEVEHVNPHKQSQWK